MEGEWTWIDGTTPTFTRWESGQPDNGTDVNHALMLNLTTNWVDASAPFTVATGYVLKQPGLDPNSADTDGDGLSDADELGTFGSNPFYVDTDRDGLDDNAEVNMHLTDPTKADTDGDTLSDLVEVTQYGTKPRINVRLPSGAWCANHIRRQ